MATLCQTLIYVFSHRFSSDLASIRGVSHVQILAIMTQSEISKLIVSIKDIAYCYALKLSNYNVQEAEDLMQDTNIRALRKCHSYEHTDIVDSFKRWYCTIMKNISFDRYRSRQSKGTDVDLEYAYSKHRVGNEGEANITIAEIQTAIAQLSDAKKVCFELMLKGYKYEEIAKMLDTNVNTVKMRIFNARESLKKVIINEESYGH